MVIGVPNSSLSAASGYAEEIGLPYEMGLVKINMLLELLYNLLRKRASVRVKLSAVKDIVDGKDIVLVDDSIVRGTTIKRIVKMLKDSGANRIHVRIASRIHVPSFMVLTYLQQLNSSQQVSLLRKLKSYWCRFSCLFKR